MNDLTLHTTEDGRSQIKLRADQIISSNGFPLLTQTCSVSHVQMESTTNALYLDYDQRRTKQEALYADEHDDADLKALKNTIKRRPKNELAGAGFDRCRPHEQAPTMFFAVYITPSFGNVVAANRSKS